MAWLYEYSYLVGEIRTFLNYGYTLEAAVDQAVEQCIGEGIMADFLRKHRAEVKDVILTEYNEERHLKNEKELSFLDGKAEGQKRFAALSQLLLKTGRADDLLRATEDEEYRERLFAENQIE